MPILELVRNRPDWFSALETALTRPEGVPERRLGEDPWNPAPIARPRRISDDLAWFRQAIDEPEANGLHAVDAVAGLPVWEAEGNPEVYDRLERLSLRGVLQAAGFELHEAVAG